MTLILCAVWVLLPLAWALESVWGGAGPSGQSELGAQVAALMSVASKRYQSVIRVLATSLDSNFREHSEGSMI